MKYNSILIILAIVIPAQLWHGSAQATNRWDVLKWCTTNYQADIARCEGFIRAALDLSTSDDFSGPKSCFLPQILLSDIRLEVIDWLKDNKTAKEKSGLALVKRAILERFPCPN